MIFPELVPKKLCVTPCTVYLTEGLNRDGSKKRTVVFEGKCYHEEKSSQKLNAEKQLVSLTGKAYFNGDVVLGISFADGYADIGGREYKIYGSEKAKNPDGTVNYTCLELI